jgi:hypothetical protein
VTTSNEACQDEAYAGFGGTIDYKATEEEYNSFMSDTPDAVIQLGTIIFETTMRFRQGNTVQPKPVSNAAVTALPALT